MTNRFDEIVAIAKDRDLAKDELDELPRALVAKLKSVIDVEMTPEEAVEYNHRMRQLREHERKLASMIRAENAVPTIVVSTL